MQILAEFWVKSALHLIIVMTSARGVSQGCPDTAATEGSEAQDM